jgi:hypothetical protein
VEPSGAGTGAGDGSAGGGRRGLGWRRGLQGHSGWSAPLFVVLLISLQLISILLPPTGGPPQMVIASLSAYGLATLFAWLMDQTERRGR